MNTAPGNSLLAKLVSHPISVVKAIAFKMDGATKCVQRKYSVATNNFFLSVGLYIWKNDTTISESRVLQVILSLESSSKKTLYSCLVKSSVYGQGSA